MKYKTMEGDIDGLDETITALDFLKDEEDLLKEAADVFPVNKFRFDKV